ncbi:MAG: hypothetical protein V4591_10150 [Bdellovibrionota bacterium]
MYTQFLFVHSWLRWLVIILLVVVIVKFFISLLKKKNYTKVDRILSSALLGSVHLQFLLGLILYFGLSPIVQQGLANFKDAMKNIVLRYWVVEHAFSLFIFVVLIQVGFSISKRASNSTKKHKTMLIFAVIAFILLMASIPWPMREYGRALLR